MTEKLDDWELRIEYFNSVHQMSDVTTSINNAYKVLLNKITLMNEKNEDDRNIADFTSINTSFDLLKSVIKEKEPLITLVNPKYKPYNNKATVDIKLITDIIDFVKPLTPPTIGKCLDKTKITELMIFCTTILTRNIPKDLNDFSILYSNLLMDARRISSKNVDWSSKSDVRATKQRDPGLFKSWVDDLT